MNSRENIRQIHPHHHHINLLLIITILLLLVVITLVKPALLGYTISKEFGAINKTASEMIKSVEMLKSDLLITETNLKSCESMKNEFQDSLTKEKSASFNCLQEKDNLESDHEQMIKGYEFNLSKLASDYEQKNTMLDLERSQLTAERDKSKGDYEEIARNSANNICCKAKVDNKEIDSYAILSNKIVCSTGEENKLNC